MNNLQGNNSRLDEAKNQINDIEVKKEKNNQSGQQDEKRIPPNKDSISDLWDNFKFSDIHIIGMPEREEKEKEIRNLFEKNNESKLP